MTTEAFVAFATQMGELVERLQYHSSTVDDMATRTLEAARKFGMTMDAKAAAAWVKGFLQQVSFVAADLRTLLDELEEAAE